MPSLCLRCTFAAVLRTCKRDAAEATPRGFTLRNGVVLPALAAGTGSGGAFDTETAEAAVTAALCLGWFEPVSRLVLGRISTEEAVEILGVSSS